MWGGGEENIRRNQFSVMSEACLTFKRKPHKMVKHTQTIRVFDDFVGLAHKGLRPCQISLINSLNAKETSHLICSANQLTGF